MAMFIGLVTCESIWDEIALHLQRVSESVNLDRCNTLIIESTCGLPWPQPSGRANSTAFGWRQQGGGKNRACQSLRVSRSACYALDTKESLYASERQTWFCRLFWVACPWAEALLHEGTIPESASRLTTTYITMSFGHGLTGLLPSISGTVIVLSLWENSLEGYLPEMHIKDESVLLVHANDFSCKLPHHRGEKPTTTASLSLIGNHFAQPRCVPTWITPAEQPTD
eukprot:680022-Amphidinium_carterae.1